MVFKKNNYFIHNTVELLVHVHAFVYLTLTFVFGYMICRLS